MKTIKDILCEAFFMTIALGVTTYGFTLITHWYWFNELLWKIGNYNACRFLMVVIVLGLYYLSKTIIWKAITHFKTK